MGLLPDAAKDHVNYNNSVDEYQMNNMNNFQLLHQVSRERQRDLQRESAEEQRWRASPAVEPRASLLSRFIHLFSRRPEAPPAASVVAIEEAKAPVADRQLGDCVAC